MRTVLILGFLLSNVSTASVNLADKHIWYYVQYLPGHKECSPLNLELMLCPTNELNVKITPRKEIEREVLAWGVLKDCDEVSDNVSLCK